MNSSRSRGWPQWRPLTTSLIALGAAMLVTAPAAAQLFGSSGLNLSASVNALYDSNELRTGSQSRLNTTQHPDDFRYSPSVSASYGRGSGRLALRVNGTVGGDFFQYNKYLDSSRYAGGGSLTYHRGTSCQLGINGNVSSRQAGIGGAGDTVGNPSLPINDPSLPFVDPFRSADDVGLLIDNVLTAANYGANASCGTPTGRLTFGGGYSHSSLSNGSSLRKFGDSDSDTFNGSLGLGILRPGQLSLNGSYSTIAYPGRTAIAPALGVPARLLDSGVQSYRIGLVFSRPIGTRLSGSIGASYLHSDSGGGLSSYSSPAYTLSLAYTASQRLGLSLSGSRDIVPSTTTGAEFRVVDQINLNGHYRLGTRISLDASAGFTANDYRNAFAILGEPARGNDTTSTFGGGVRFTPRRLFDVSLNVTQSIRRSDQAIFNYSSTQAGITLAAHI